MESRLPDARKAMVLHDRQLVVDLIQLTLNHGLFIVRAATSLEEAETILADWRPDMGYRFIPTFSNAGWGGSPTGSEERPD